MHFSERLAIFAWIVFAVLSTGPAMADEKWVVYASPTYGFHMMIPDMTSLSETRAGQGWGSVRAIYLQTEIVVLVKPGAAAETIEFRTVALQLTRILPGDWKVVDAGRHRQGFMWYKVIEAYRATRVVYGIFGVGARGSYIFFLQTDPQTFHENKPAFVRWFESIRLDP